MRQPRVRIDISLSKEHGDMLERMAAEAGVKPVTLARTIIESVLEDDAKAHREAEMDAVADRKIA